MNIGLWLGGCSTKKRYIIGLNETSHNIAQNAFNKIDIQKAHMYYIVRNTNTHQHPQKRVRWRSCAYVRAFMCVLTLVLECLADDALENPMRDIGRLPWDRVISASARAIPAYETARGKLAMIPLTSRSRARVWHLSGWRIRRLQRYSKFLFLCMKEMFLSM